MVKGKSLLATGDPSSPVLQKKSKIKGWKPTAEQWRQMNRELILESACALAREDDQFRIDLKQRLEFIGEGKPGRISPLGEHAELLMAYKNALKIIEACGEKPTKKAAIELMLSGPFEGRSFEGTGKLILKLLKKEGDSSGIK
jgi:hypothetical protein